MGIDASCHPTGVVRATLPIPHVHGAVMVGGKCMTGYGFGKQLLLSVRGCYPAGCTRVQLHSTFLGGVLALVCHPLHSPASKVPVLPKVKGHPHSKPLMNVRAGMQEQPHGISFFSKTDGVICMDCVSIRMCTGACGLAWDNLSQLFYCNCQCLVRSIPDSPLHLLGIQLPNFNFNQP